MGFGVWSFGCCTSLGATFTAPEKLSRILQAPSSFPVKNLGAHGTYQPTITGLRTVLVTILGALRGLLSGLRSTMNLQEAASNASSEMCSKDGSPEPALLTVLDPSS